MKHDIAAGSRDDWVGLQGQVVVRIEESDTARALGSGDVLVLGTPRLIAVLEEASVAAILAVVADEDTSVGTRIDVLHRRPTPVGAELEAVARVASVEGSRVEFEVSADHLLPSGEREANVGRGTITRAIVARADFPS